MGYRSDVGVVLKRDDYERMVEMVRQSSYEVKSLFDYASVSYNENYCVVYWDSVKWYTSYDEVIFFDKFFRSLENYYFLRLGESSSDIEEEIVGDEYDMFNCMSLERSIWIDDSMERK